MREALYQPSGGLAKRARGRKHSHHVSATHRGKCSRLFTGSSSSTSSRLEPWLPWSCQVGDGQELHLQGWETESGCRVGPQVARRVRLGWLRWDIWVEWGPREFTGAPQGELSQARPTCWPEGGQQELAPWEHSTEVREQRCSHGRPRRPPKMPRGSGGGPEQL